MSKLHLNTYNLSEAKHAVECRHQYNYGSHLTYYMPCIILKEMPNNRVKVVVFGDRMYLGDGETKKIRYLHRNRIVKRSELKEAKK